MTKRGFPLQLFIAEPCAGPIEGCNELPFMLKLSALSIQSSYCFDYSEFYFAVDLGFGFRALKF